MKLGLGLGLELGLRFRLAVFEVLSRHAIGCNRKNDIRQHFVTNADCSRLYNVYDGQAQGQTPGEGAYEGKDEGVDADQV